MLEDTPNRKLQDEVRYIHREENIEHVEVSNFKKENLEFLVKYLPTVDDPKAKSLFKKVQQYLKLTSDDTGQKVIKRLTDIPNVAIGFLSVAAHKWVFTENNDGALVPYYVEKIKHHSTRTSYGHTTPAHVTITVVATGRKGKKEREFTWWARSLGKNIRQLFAEHDLYRESVAMVEDYHEEMVRYSEYQTQTGLQVSGTGVGMTEDSEYYWRNSNISLTVEGRSVKLVIDDEKTDEEEVKRKKLNEDNLADTSFWRQDIPKDFVLTLPKKAKKKKRKLDDEDYNDEDTVFELTNEEYEVEEEVIIHDDEEIDSDDVSDESPVLLPFHPYIRVFDLERHQYLSTHTNNLEDYKWDESLFDKLVLGKDKKELIQMLINSANDRVEDIIKGKMSGVIIMATGVPGIGKTLTAEIFSESIQKPLYSVQCSQLGLSIDAIEKNLKNVMQRASRWNAILLIDEADVYIRQRGDDIQQNAIVGVFLRILEYYRGVLFMTSNRGDIIDDAIISRATAWIKYELPEVSELKQIWNVLGTQYEAKFSDKDVDELITQIPNISGRTVRNLLKLARMLSQSSREELTKETILKVKDYQKLDSSNGENGTLAGNANYAG